MMPRPRNLYKKPDSFCLRCGRTLNPTECSRSFYDFSRNRRRVKFLECPSCWALFAYIEGLKVPIMLEKG